MWLEEQRERLRHIPGAGTSGGESWTCVQHGTLAVAESLSLERERREKEPDDTCWGGPQ